MPARVRSQRRFQYLALTGLVGVCACKHAYGPDVIHPVDPAIGSRWLAAAEGDVPDVVITGTPTLGAVFGNVGQRMAFPIEAVAVSADAAVVAVASAADASIVVDRDGSAQRVDLGNHGVEANTHVVAVGIDAAGDWLGAVASDRSAWLVDLSSGKPTRLTDAIASERRPADAWIGQVAFAEAAPLVVLAGGAWRLETDLPKRISGDDNRVLWASDDGTRFLSGDIGVVSSLVTGSQCGFQSTRWHPFGRRYGFGAPGVSVPVDAALPLSGYPRHLDVRGGAIAFASTEEPNLAIYIPAGEGSEPRALSMDAPVTGLSLSPSARHLAVMTPGTVALMSVDDPSDRCLVSDPGLLPGRFVDDDHYAASGQPLQIVRVATGESIYEDPGIRRPDVAGELAVAAQAGALFYTRSPTHLMRYEPGAKPQAAQGAEIVALAEGPQGRLASVARDGSVWQWMPDGRGMPLVNGDMNRPGGRATLERLSVAFDRSGAHIVAEVAHSGRGHIRVWQAETGQPVHEFRGRTGAILPSGDVVMEASLGQLRTRFSPLGGSPLAALPRWSRRDKFIGLESAAFPRDDEVAYVPVWHIDEQAIVVEKRRLRSRRVEASLPAIGARSPWLTVVDEAGTALVVTEGTQGWRFDLTTQTVAAQFEVGAPAIAGAMSPDGRAVALATRDGLVELWQGAQRVATIDLRPADELPTAVAWGPSGLHVGTLRGLLVRFVVPVSLEARSAAGAPTGTG